MKQQIIQNPLDKLYSWDTITGKQYWDIYKALYDDSTTDIQKEAEICSIIENISTDDFMELPVQDALDRIKRLEFLNTFKLIRHYNPKFIVLNGVKYKIIQAADMNVAQFIDYQNFITQKFEYAYDKILSVFLVPENMDYNDGYDIAALQNSIQNDLSWREVQSLLNFILTKYLESLHSTLRYLVKQARKTRDQELKKKLLGQIREAKHSLSTLMGTFASLRGTRI